MDILTCALKNRMPSLASLSMLGVILGAAPPKQPGLSQFMSSATRRRTLGLFFGATNCCEKPLAESANRHSSNTNLME